MKVSAKTGLRRSRGDVSLPVRVDFGNTWPSGRFEDFIARRLGARVQEGLSSLMESLGLQGHVVVTMGRSEYDVPIVMRVGGVLLPYAWPTVTRVCKALDPASPDLGSNEETRVWVTQKLQSDAPYRADVELQFLVQLSLQLVLTSPEVLSGTAQAEAYHDRRPGRQANSRPPHEWTSADSSTFMRSLLGLGVSLKGLPTLWGLANQGSAWGLATEDIAELAFSALRRRRVQIVVSRGDWPTFTTAPPWGVVAADDRTVTEPIRSEIADAVHAVRQALGVPVRMPWLVPSSLDKGQMVIGVNALRSLPMQLPEDDPQALARALAKGAHDAISLHPERLVAAEDIELQMRGLYDESPHLLGIVLSVMTTSELARVLRSLLRDNVTLRDLTVVLESMVAVMDRDDIRSAFGGARSEAIAEAVRSQDLLWGEVSRLHATDDGVVAAVEFRHDRASLASFPDTENISPTDGSGGREELWMSVLSSWRPGRVLLVDSPAARRALGLFLSGELQEIPVVSRQELSPELRITTA